MPTNIHGRGKERLWLAVKYGTAFDVLESLEAGDDVGEPNRLNETPLHWACLMGDRAKVQMLLSFGADRDAEDIFGQKPAIPAPLN